MVGKSLNRFIQKRQYFFTESWLRGFFWRCWLGVSKRKLIVEGSCNRCGECCRSLSIEGYNGWLKTESEFVSLTRMRPEYKRFIIVGKSGGCLLFSCSQLREDGRCGDYENRPTLCREFPHHNLLIAGAKMPANCGYYFRESAL